MNRLAEIRPHHQFRDMLAFATKVGHWLMDVSGIGAILEKIEEYFGKRIARALLLVVMIAAFVSCIYAIVTLGLLPIAAILKGVGPATLWPFLGKFAVLLAITIVTAGVFYFSFSWWANRRIKELTEKAEKIVAEAVERAELADLLLEEAQRRVNESKKGG